jgi:hypothetical protein
MNQDLLHRVKQMADEQHAMQEMLHNLPRWEARAHIELMEEHAIKLSRLASRLYGERREVGGYVENDMAPEEHKFRQDAFR